MRKEILAILLMVIASLPVLHIGAQSKADAELQMRKLQFAEQAVKYFYVDTVNETKLVEDAIRGMLEILDPHSSYSTPKEGSPFAWPQRYESTTGCGATRYC